MTPLTIAAIGAAVLSACVLGFSVWVCRRMRFYADQATAHAERSEAALKRATAARERSEYWAVRATAARDRAEAAQARRQGRPSPTTPSAQTEPTGPASPPSQTAPTLPQGSSDSGEDER